MWVIVNIHNGKEYWSNFWGWVGDEEESFTLFTDEEKEKFDLPIDGRWHKFE